MPEPAADDVTPPELVDQRLALLDVDELEPHPENPNEGDLGAIEASMAELGFFGAVLAQAPTAGRARHRIIAGEHRWRTARAQGLAQVPVLVVDVDDETATRMLLADTETARRARYNTGRLTAVLAELVNTPRGLAGVVFTGTDLDRLAKLAGPDHEPPPPAPPEPDPPPAVPVTQPGDLWLCGRHRVLCADVLADGTGPAELDRLLAGDPVDLVLTDPPFAIYGSSTGIASDIADDAMVRPFFAAMFRAIRAHLVEYGQAYVHCDWRSYASLWATCSPAGLTVKNCLVWDKGGSGMGNNWANTHELVLYAANEPSSGTMTSKRRAGQRPVLRPNVLHYPRPTGDDRLHNAAKHPEMEAEIIEAASDPGALVLDLFAGSGTTLIAAERTGRRACLSDKSPAAVDVTVARWARLTGEDPVLEATGEPHRFGAP